MTGAVPLRLKQIRVLLEFEGQQQMADFLDVSFNRYNNVERGSPLSHDLAVRICQKVPGMTLDWLYFGKTDGLPLGLAKRLGEVPMADTVPSKKGKSRRA